MKPITLLLVDDHAVMRMGLASLLETCRDVKVVGDTGDGESAVRMALRLRPDVVVMDLVIPEMDGVEALKKIRRQGRDPQERRPRRTARGYPRRRRR